MPKRRSMIAELNHRAAAADMGAMEWLLAELESGRMAYEVAEDLGGSVNMLRQWAYLQHNGKARWQGAMTERSHSLVEQGVKIIRDLRDTDFDKVDVAAAKVEVDQLNLIARAHNRPVYGTDQAAVNVQVNLGDLHLDAFRHRAVKPAAAVPLLEKPAEAEYQVLEAEA